MGHDAAHFCPGLAGKYIAGMMTNHRPGWLTAGPAGVCSEQPYVESAMLGLAAAVGKHISNTLAFQHFPTLHPAEPIQIHSFDAMLL